MTILQFLTQHKCQKQKFYMKPMPSNKDEANCVTIPYVQVPTLICHMDYSYGVVLVFAHKSMINTLSTNSLCHNKFQRCIRLAFRHRILG